MEETGITLCRARVLVVGFGRVGKMLSHRLHSLGADVTVSARKLSDMAWIQAYGYKAANTLRLESVLPDFNIIFNTVPARVLGEDRLKLVSPPVCALSLPQSPGAWILVQPPGLALSLSGPCRCPAELPL
jgi:dipicolinate synthase subunit A